MNFKINNSLKIIPVQKEIYSSPLCTLVLNFAILCGLWIYFFTTKYTKVLTKGHEGDFTGNSLT